MAKTTTNITKMVPRRNKLNRINRRNEERVKFKRRVTKASNSPCNNYSRRTEMDLRQNGEIIAETGQELRRQRRTRSTTHHNMAPCEAVSEIKLESPLNGVKRNNQTIVEPKTKASRRANSKMVQRKRMRHNNNNNRASLQKYSEHNNTTRTTSGIPSDREQERWKQGRRKSQQEKHQPAAS